MLQRGPAGLRPVPADRRDLFPVPGTVQHGLTGPLRPPPPLLERRLYAVLGRNECDTVPGLQETVERGDPDLRYHVHLRHLRPHALLRL